MKTKLPAVITVLILLSFPKVNFGQAPDFGTLANFSLFTVDGAISNTGVSNISGNIGTNNGLVTGFETSSVSGALHSADAITNQCSIDLLAAFNQLYATPSTAIHLPVLGNGETLYAGVYSIAAAGSLVSVLTLDAQGDSNAIFIFKVGAAFTTAASSAISLVHGASANNVFWIAGGAISMGASTIMRGTLISNNAAISIGAGSTLTGRMFSTTGAVNTNGLSAYAFLQAPVKTYGQQPNLGMLTGFVLFATTGATGNTGDSHITGNVGANVGVITGFSPGNLTGSIYNTDAITERCSQDLMAAYNQLNAAIPTSLHLPVLGKGEILFPGVYSLAAAASVASVLTLDAQGDPNAVFIFKTGGALTTGASTTVNLINGASACNVFWVAEGAISMAALTTMKGTLISHNAAVSMGAGGMLEGRLFSTTGAASFYGVSATIPVGCSVATSWTGAAGTADWFTLANWSTVIPGKFSEALIPATLLAGRFFPVINTGIAAVDTLTIQGAASLIVTNSTLQINGAINNTGTLNARNGTIEMTGLSGQTLAAKCFQNNAINNLLISNISHEGVILSGALDVYGSLAYSGTNMKLITNDSLTLKSTALNTAWISDVTGNTISGNVTVERYISARKGWRLLSIPTNTLRSVKQTWQEGATNAASNPYPGHGMQITSNRTTWSADGFDAFTAGGASMEIYNLLTNTWVGIGNTNSLPISITGGYMTFIRGDRAANSVSSPATETVLRTKGDLYTGNQTPITVNPGKFASIGNPYASPLDMRYITKTGMKDFFYVWDPQLGGINGYGGYQTFSYNGSDYIITPGLGSYGANGSVSNYIESGLAFLMQADSAGSGTVTFKESAKARNMGVVSVAAKLPQPQLSATLYGINAVGKADMLDAVLINYDDRYNNALDALDAVKPAGSSENFSIKSHNSALVIERKQNVGGRDTIFLNLTNMKAQKYRLECKATLLGQPGVTGYLEDTYRHTSSSLNLNGSEFLDFNITRLPASYAAGRFRIIFTTAIELPYIFTTVNAFHKNKDITVEWAIRNESRIVQYNVEKSIDGNNYLLAGIVAANKTARGNYSWLDIHPSAENNYYRIVTTGVKGETEYSKIVMVNMAKEKQSLSICPGPISNGIINVLFTNQPAGCYKMQLLNEMGQLIISKQIVHPEGNSSETIRIDNNTPHGIYQLCVTGPGGIKVIQQVSINFSLR